MLKENDVSIISQKDGVFTFFSSQNGITPSSFLKLWKKGVKTHEGFPQIMNGCFYIKIDADLYCNVYVLAYDESGVNQLFFPLNAKGVG